MAALYVCREVGWLSRETFLPRLIDIHSEEFFISHAFVIK